MASPASRASALDAARRPRLRRDLRLADTDVGGAPSLVLGDRTAGRYLRFGPEARSLLELLDGERTVAEIAAAASEAARGTVPVAEVAELVDLLARRGLLEGVPGAPEPRRLDPFALRLRLFDPEPLAARLDGLGRALFSGAGCAALVLLGAAGAAALALLGPAAVVPPLAGWSTLAAFYLAAAAALTLHELGHALALHARGGVTHEAGLLLLYGLPCLYVNVSDAWLLPRRRDRLVVSAAGLLVELGLFGLAALALALLPLTGLPAVAAFAVAAVCGTRSLLANLNPLIRLDGYYLLSDAVGVPNLRAKALAALARLPARRIGGGPAVGSKRERTLLPLFGALSLAYTVAVLGTVLYLSARWSVGRAGLAGLAVWGAAGTLFLARAFAALRPAPAAREER